MDFLTFSSFSPSFFLALSAVPTSSAQPTFSRRYVCEWKFQKRLGAMICVQISWTSSAFLAQASKPMMPLAGAAVKGHMFCHTFWHRKCTPKTHMNTQWIFTRTQNIIKDILYEHLPLVALVSIFGLSHQLPSSLFQLFIKEFRKKTGTHWDVRNPRKNWRFYRFSMSTGWPNVLPSESQGWCPSFDRHWWCESSGGATIRGTFAES